MVSDYSYGTYVRAIALSSDTADVYFGGKFTFVGPNVRRGIAAVSRATGTVTYGRPAYAQLLCFSRGLRLAPGASSADVLPELGNMPWVRAMGQAACVAAGTFLQRHTACTTIVDPFCGVGTMLAVGNAMGFHAVGVELSRKRAEAARTLTVTL